MIAVSVLMFLLMLSSQDVCANEKKAFKIDLSHSTVGFSVKHMGVGITRGVFKDYTGEAEFDAENLDDFTALIVIQAKSVDTRLEARDNHLRGVDFFDVENFPTITFKATKLVKKENGYELTGDFTLHGVTREVSTLVQIRGPIQSPFGGEVIGISGEFMINRQDYDVSWNDIMPDGGVVVDNMVTIILDLEGDRE